MVTIGHNSARQTAESVYGSLLALGYELLVDVQRGARTRMPHLRLRVLHVGTRHLQPGRVRGSQTPPVHPGQPQRASGRLEEPREYVVVAKWTPGPNSLEDQIIWAIRLHNLAFACRATTLTSTVPCVVIANRSRAFATPYIRGSGSFVAYATAPIAL